MGRSQETFNKKEVRNKKEKKRKDKERKRIERKAQEKTSNLDDMIVYVDENGNLSETVPDPTKKKEVIAENIEINIPKHDDVVMDVIRKGVVTFFNDSKGFGFIKDSETKESIFVHVNNVIDEIKDNNVVNFEVEMGPKGLTALNVKIYKEPVKPKVVAPTEEAKAEDKKPADTKAEGTKVEDKKPEEPKA